MTVKLVDCEHCGKQFSPRGIQTHLRYCVGQNNMEDYGKPAGNAGILNSKSWLEKFLYSPCLFLWWLFLASFFLLVLYGNLI